MNREEVEFDMSEIVNLQPGTFAYLGTPYSKYRGGLDAAASEAARIAANLLKRGVIVYSPIAHSHAVAEAGTIDPVDHDLWVRADAPFVQAASALIVATMDGWQESRGLAHEIAAFTAAGKPVVYLDPEEA